MDYPLDLIRPRRRIAGYSAILLPFAADGSVDWPAFRRHVARTAGSGLVPAVNMDTGYAHLIDDATRLRALDETRGELGGGEYVAGAAARDRPGSPFNADAYARAASEVQQFGGTPVIFQSFGLTELPEDEIMSAYQKIASHCDRFIGFELSQQFAPFGRIYSLETYAGLMEIPQCVGAKHSSLRREPEWERLRLRDARRPDFRVFTGNDLAIDMVMYGSDYLLGLSTFAPEAFARRDELWANGDAAFAEWNDVLQYLGWFAFRPPVPAYKHSAAQFLHLTGAIASDRTHPGSPERPASDLAVLADIAARLRDLGACG